MFGRFVAPGCVAPPLRIHRIRGSRRASPGTTNHPESDGEFLTQDTSPDYQILKPRHMGVDSKRFYRSGVPLLSDFIRCE